MKNLDHGVGAGSPIREPGEFCKHNWKEEYYGTRCDRCDLFYPFGCAPWDDDDPWSDDDDYMAACGEFD